jgi:hypothetical protein
MWAKRYKIEEANFNEEIVKALRLISEIPLPVTKKYLETIGFEVE